MNYLDNTRKLFRYYRQLGSRAMAQLNEAQIRFQPDAGSLSIALIVKHLHGNMRSRFTNFLAEDGEKPWRRRDAEFSDEGHAYTLAEVEHMWNEGWDCLLHTLDSLTDADLDKIVYIRNEGHTVLEAINRQLAHYAYHVGQIVFAAKMQVRENWQSLSIAPGKSGEFNAEKFNREKEIRHFTDR